MSKAHIEFTIHQGQQTAAQTVTIESTIIAGWTGRDPVALEKHIRELEELGVARPASTPIYYRVANARLTTSSVIEVSGGESSGEVEFAIVRSGGMTYIGVGSDHTDRKAETFNVTVSKQMCEKPMASQLWAFDDVKDHWDQLILRSWAVINGERVLYQEGNVVSMLAPEDVMGGYSADGLPENSVMFCGTLAAKGGIRPASRFEFEIEDPVLGRRISHGYDVVELPVLG